MTDLMVFVDIENFGLAHRTDPILEIGVHLVDNDFKVVNTFSTPVWDPTVSPGRHDILVADAAYEPNEKRRENAQYVLDLHTNNGLFEEAQKFGLSFKLAERQVKDFLKDNHAEGSPMYGASVQFDRESLRTWMPGAHDAFHYRNVDVSTLKTLCQRFSPKMYAGLAEDVPWETDHRVDNCLKGTVAELDWYATNFLFIPGGQYDL